MFDEWKDIKVRFLITILVSIQMNKNASGLVYIIN